MCCIHKYFVKIITFFGISKNIPTFVVQNQKMMKTIKLSLIFLLVLIFCKVQSQTIKTKTFFWGDSEKVFYNELTDSGKTLLDSCFKIIKVDTINSVRLTSDDLVKYTSREYLSKHNYDYLTIYKHENVLNIRKYSNDLPPSNNTNKKVLLRYSKDDKNKIDKITMHVID